MRSKLSDVFRRHRILGKLEQRVRVEGFTQPGDPMRLDFGYQNGARGFIHSVSLRRDLPQAKALAYTAGCIHARDARRKSRRSPTLCRTRKIPGMCSSKNFSPVNGYGSWR